MSESIPTSYKLIGYPEAVAILHEHGLTDLDEEWLRGQADRGKLPSTVIAKKRRFLDVEVKKFIDSMAQDAVTVAPPKPRPTLLKKNVKRRFS
ncbi:hypothetical protein MAL1_00093 [Bacteriophage DSS3_MAL1]|nr:hypothetical protein MAL1_00093 [Bacteriophage DSS3_MAL1]